MYLNFTSRQIRLAHLDISEKGIYYNDFPDNSRQSWVLSLFIFFYPFSTCKFSFVCHEIQGNHACGVLFDLSLFTPEMLMI